MKNKESIFPGEALRIISERKKIVFHISGLPAESNYALNNSSLDHLYKLCRSPIDSVEILFIHNYNVFVIKNNKLVGGSLKAIMKG